MENLIVITAHCPTSEQEIVLEECLDSVLKCGYHVALISHTHIPIHIQKKCHYYVYDYLNDVSQDMDLLGHQFFYTGNFQIISKFFNKNFYGFAIYRMFVLASQIAINFGYKNIHHIEYDCKLLDENLIFENSNFLENYDSVIYTSNGKKDGFLFGSLKSFRVNSLPVFFKKFSRDYMDKFMRDVEYKHLEAFTKKIFLESGEVLFLPEPADDRFQRGRKFYIRNLHYTLFYDDKNKHLNLFYNSNKDTEEEIFILINKKVVLNLKILPNQWYIRPLGVFDEIQHVRIDNSKKVIYEIRFHDDNREKFKQNSYIKYYEKNS